jgi:hypothetical protein
MADTCRTCQLVHVPEVTCVAAQGLAMRSLLEKVGQKSTCAGCLAEIYFVRHLNGNTAPYTPAGLNHFISCPQRATFKRAKS